MCAITVAKNGFFISVMEGSLANTCLHYFFSASMRLLLLWAKGLFKKRFSDWAWDVKDFPTSPCYMRIILNVTISKVTKWISEWRQFTWQLRPCSQQKFTFFHSVACCAQGSARDPFKPTSSTGASLMIRLRTTLNMVFKVALIQRCLNGMSEILQECAFKWLVFNLKSISIAYKCCL